MKQGRTYANSVCSARNQSQSESFEQKARLGVSPKQREARADQERLRRPPGAFATWQAAGGRAPPATSPERWGRSWASRPSRCAVAARALTPIHSDSAPQAPARASGAFFEWRAGQGVGAARSPAGARTRPLDATGATQACRRGCRGALPRHPCPSAKAPAGSPEGAVGVRCRGHPLPGFKGRAALGPSAANKKPSAEGEHFCSSSFALRLFGPQRGA